MKRHLVLLISLLLVQEVLAQSFDDVFFEMTKRSSSNGVLMKTTAEVCFNVSGKMVMHMTYPTESYVFNDTYGQTQIYNPEENSIIKSFDVNQSTGNMVYYYFLTGNVGDMGLAKAGFTLLDSKIDNMMLVSTYKAPGTVSKKVDKVELVSNGEHPVFMGYMKDGNYIQKVYFYDYSNIGNVEFPRSISQVNYVASDSIVSKSTFSGFQFNSESARALLDFHVPQDAVILN